MGLVARTPRLVLRRFEARDERAVVRIFADAEVMRYIGSGGALGPERARAALARWTAEQGPTDFTMWAVEEAAEAAGAPIGWCGLKALQDSGLIEVGWVLDRPYWGRGLATEAAGAALTFGFEVGQLERIVAVAHPANAPSLGIMRKLGMRDEGPAHFYDTEVAFYSLERDRFVRPPGVELTVGSANPRGAA